ncbi:MAG: hypothetical protein ABI426_10320 [Flavobacterium sp.]
MKTKFVTAIKFFLLLLVVSLHSCQDDNADVSPAKTIENQSVNNFKKELTPLSSQELPEIVQKQLNLSKENLSKHLKNDLQITGITVLGKLSTEKGLIDAQNLLSAKETRIAFGNITDPTSVVIGKMQNLYVGKELSASQTNIKDVAVQEIKTDDNVLEISWIYKSEKFTTLCFYRNSGIVWDNVLGGLIMMDSKANVETSKNDNQAKIASRWYKQWWTADWIWGSQRGEIGYQITIYYSGSTVSNTDVNDWGNMSLGSARSESKITKNTGSYGQCRYALGLCTPTGSLSFSYSSFSVSFSGLGSNIVSNGYKSLYP